MGASAPVMMSHEDHEEDFSDRNERRSILLIAIADTRRFCVFVRGLAGSRGDSLAIRDPTCSCAMETPDAPLPPMRDGEFILGASGFALSALL